MIVMEGSFIGVRFALLRLVLTVLCVLAAGYLVELMIPADELAKMASSAEQS
jgi:uncharacterized membrane protein YraQ (UPF0718 family)